MLEDKIKMGYLYQIGTGKLQVATGHGGVINYIKSCRDLGMPDDVIEEDIFITDAETIMTGMQWHCIKDIKWVKKDD